MKKRLQELLNELHAELGDAESLDAAAKQQLRDMAAEIDTKVAAAAESGEQVESDLQTAVLEFETDHPRITGILGRIADALSKMGI